MVPVGLEFLLAKGIASFYTNVLIFNKIWTWFIKKTNQFELKIGASSITFLGLKEHSHGHYVNI